MEFDKRTSIVTAVGLIAILLILPIKIDVAYPILYYAIAAVIAVWTAIRATAGKRGDERFYRRWAKKKQAGKWGIVLLESLKSLILLVAIVALGSMLLGGTPQETLNELSPGMRAGTAALLIAFSVVLGFADLQEKNRRFERLHAQYRKS